MQKKVAHNIHILLWNKIRRLRRSPFTSRQLTKYTDPIFYLDASQPTQVHQNQDLLRLKLSYNNGQISFPCVEIF